MSVAAQQDCARSRLLDQRHDLRDPLDGLAQVFFADIDPLLDAPWRVAEFDFIYPQTRGQCLADFKQRAQYDIALMQLAARNPSVHRTLTEVSMLLRPQSVLREPQLADRVHEVMRNLATQTSF